MTPPWGLSMSAMRKNARPAAAGSRRRWAKGTSLGLLHELLPQAMSVGVFLNPRFQPAEGQLSDLRKAARTIGLPLHVLRASSKRYGASRDASVCSAGE
jgi:hypothetical protein